MNDKWRKETIKLATLVGELDQAMQDPYSPASVLLNPTSEALKEELQHWDILIKSR